MGMQTVQRNGQSAPQQLQADPDAVIQRLGMQVGHLQVALTVRDDIIDQLQRELAELRSEASEDVSEDAEPAVS